VVIGRGAKTAAAEAFTDSLEHRGRDIQVDLNVSLAGRCSVAVEVSFGTAHPSSTPCESVRSSVRGRAGHDFVECFVQGCSNAYLPYREPNIKLAISAKMRNATKSRKYVRTTK